MKTNIPDVDIVVFNYNGLADTKVCIQSLLKTKYPNFKIYVIDDASDKDEISELQRIFPAENITFIRGNKNKNFAFRANQALRLSGNKYVLLLNNDTKVEPDWLNYLVLAAEKDNRVAVCQPKIKSMDRAGMFEYAGGSGGFIDRLGYPYTRGRVIFHVERDRGQYDDEIEIFWASGTAMLVNREIAKKIGGFDEKFIAYAEETDLCWRLIRKGYTIKVVPSSVIYHKGAASWVKQSERKIFLIHRNHLALLVKHEPWKDLVWIIPLRIFMDYLSIFYYLQYHSPRFALSVLKAHVSFLEMFTGLAKNRSKGVNPNFMPFSIVWNFFSQQKRNYRDIITDRYNIISRKTIAFVVLNCKKTTGNKVIFEQANAFNSKNYEVRVYTIFGTGPSWFRLDVPVQNFMSSVLNRRPRVLVASFWPTAYLIRFFMMGVRKIYFSQDWEEDFYTNPLIRFFVRRTYKLPLINVTNSKYVTDKITDYKGHFSPVYTACYSVLNTSLFNAQGRKKNRVLKKKKIKILSVMSWYNLHKGPDILVKAVQELKKKHREYYFILATREKSPYKPVFDKFVSDPGQSVLARLYRTSDFLLATSRTEGFFIPGIEAMASGCIFITTNSKGVLDYTTHGKNAYVLKRVSDLWKKDVINKILSDRVLEDRFRRNGIRTAERYDSKYILQNFEKFYFPDDV